jgi:hypothetical protein
MPAEIAAAFEYALLLTVLTVALGIATWRVLRALIDWLIP